MKIAVLGWGSLIWNPRNLEIRDIEWKGDGPLLPIEFARISQDGRLTLVLYPAANPVQVLWNYMAIENLNAAIKNLRVREGTIPEKIGFINLVTGKSRCNVIPDIEIEIKNWAKAKGFDAVIWTDLSSNFENKTNMIFNEDTVINYLKNLEPSKLENAKKYIVKAPKQIRTRIREVIEERLGWL